MKYTQAFDIAKIAVENMEARGWRFRDGVVREAALAAVPQPSDEAVVTALMCALNAYRSNAVPEGAVL